MIDPSRDRLLLACLQARWDPTQLDLARRIAGQSDVDWNAFLDQVAEHAVGSLLHDTLKEEPEFPPGWVKRKLQATYYHTAFRNTYLYGQLVSIIRAFDKASQPVVLLKGVAWAQALYGNVALRPVGDVDILVKSRDWEDVERLLLHEGSEASLAHPDFGDHSVFRLGGSVPANLEVHSHIVGSPYYRRRMPEEWLWEDTRALAIDGAPAHMLSAEKTVIHACVHLLQHGGHHLRWVCDIVEMCRDPNLDWDVLVHLAVQSRVVLPMRIALERCRELLELPIPEDVLKRMNKAQIRAVDRVAYLFCLARGHTPASTVLFDFVVMPGLLPRFAFLRYWLSAKRRRKTSTRQA
jgi:hypothetical protein